MFQLSASVTPSNSDFTKGLPVEPDWNIGHHLTSSVTITCRNRLKFQRFSKTAHLQEANNALRTWRSAIKNNKVQFVIYFIFYFVLELKCLFLNQMFFSFSNWFQSFALLEKILFKCVSNRWSSTVQNQSGSTA